MISFEEFLTESNAEPLLNESVTFQTDNDTSMVKNVDELVKWYHYGYSRNTAYTTDGKFSFLRNRGSHVLYVTETGSYGKSGNANTYTIKIDSDADMNGKFINALTDISKVVETAEQLKAEGVVIDVYKSTIKNTSVGAFHPLLLKNFKSIGSVSGKDKLNKVQARKIIASGDFDSISHDYQMRDDNYNSSGDIKLTYSNIIMVLDTLDSKHTSIMKNTDSESFSIYVHSNLSYYINRD